MVVATMTSKGQVTIPKEIRDELGLTPGARISFSRNEHGDFILRRQRRRIQDFIGIVTYDGPPVSLEEMDEAIGAALAEDDARIRRGE